MTNILVGNWMLLLLVMLRLVAELKLAADLDLLTGLSNRRGFRRHLDGVLARIAKQGGSVGVLLLDIDHFKSVNDRFGHQTGDKVLVVMGQVLTSLKIGGCEASRWGGEEFCVVVENPSPQRLVELASSIRKQFQKESALVVDDGVGRTVSVGIAYSNPDLPVEMARLISDADGQLYRSKQEGRDRVSISEVHHQLGKRNVA